MGEVVLQTNFTQPHLPRVAGGVGIQNGKARSDSSDFQAAVFVLNEFALPRLQRARNDLLLAGSYPVSLAWTFRDQDRQPKQMVYPHGFPLDSPKTRTIKKTMVSLCCQTTCLRVARCNSWLAMASSSAFSGCLPTLPRHRKFAALRFLMSQGLPQDADPNKLWIGTNKHRNWFSWGCFEMEPKGNHPCWGFPFVRGSSTQNIDLPKLNRATQPLPKV